MTIFWSGLALLALAWLTAAATAVRSVSRIWLRHWVDRQLSGAGAAEAYIERPHRLLLGAAAGVAVTVALAGMALANGADGWRLVGLLAGFALALLVLGQLLPRAVARRWAASLIPLLLPPLRALTALLSPVTGVAEAIAGPFRRHEGDDGDSARDEIEELLREGELEGIGEPEEIEIISGVVEFGEKLLIDAMTPRTDVFAVEESLAPDVLARAIAHSGYSRIPVYRGSLDEIVGMVHVFDLLKCGGDERPPIRQVAHAPTTKRCSEMLFEMLRAQRHLAVVVDEYGGTAGIVTLEDVLEELVGDIRDEHDDPAPTDVAPAARAVVLDASTELTEVERVFAVELGDADARTVGGLITRAGGRIPAVGDRYRIGPLEATVVDAERTRATRVLLQRADAAAPVDATPAR